MEEFHQQGPESRIVEGIPEDLNSGIKFFSNRLCPFAHRAWWSLYEKEAVNEIDYIHIELGANKPKWYSDLTPLSTVPLLYDNGKAIYESLIVAEYLDEKYKGRGTSLLPEEPEKRALVRLLISRFADKIVKPAYEFLMNPNIEERERLSTALTAAVTSFNKEVNYFSPSAGPYYLGDQFSLVDIAVNPFIERFLATLKYYRDYDFITDAPEYNRVYSSLEACKTRPAFQATSQKTEFYIWAYTSYAKKRYADN